MIRRIDTIGRVPSYQYRVSFPPILPFFIAPLVCTWPQLSLREMEGWIHKNGTIFTGHWRYLVFKDGGLTFYSDDNKKQLRSQFKLLSASDGGMDRPINKPSRHLVTVTARKSGATSGDTKVVSSSSLANGIAIFMRFIWLFNSWLWQSWQRRKKQGGCSRYRQ